MYAVKIRRSIDIEVTGIGAKIKQARKKDGRSVEVLAGEAGISRSYWHDIEAERVRDALPEDTLRKVEQVLGIDLDINFHQAGSYARSTIVNNIRDIDLVTLLAADSDANPSELLKKLKELLNRMEDKSDV